MTYLSADVSQQFVIGTVVCKSETFQDQTNPGPQLDDLLKRKMLTENEWLLNID